MRLFPLTSKLTGTTSSSPTPGFDPRFLFQSGEKGFLIQPAFYSGADGSAVAAITDYSGNGVTISQGTGASQPLFERVSADLAYLDFDGTNDFLQTSAIDFSGTNKMTVIAGVTKDSDAARGVIVELTTGVGAAQGFVLTAPEAASPTYGMFCNGGAVSGGSFAAFAAPRTDVLAARYDMSQSAPVNSNRLNVNSVAAAFTQVNPGPAGAGNFANAAVYIGRRAGTSLPFNGRIWFLLVIGRLLSDSELSDAELYANQYTQAF